jgi:peptidyl-prolyl cis-trans isomerase C
MKIGLSLPLLIASSFAPLGWSQTAPPSPAPAAAAKPQGPEAVAAQDPNRVVATINGQKITAKRVADMLKAFPPEQRKQIDANLTKAVEQIYMQEQLADAAERLNLEQQSPWKDQLELNRRGILARAYVAHLSDTAAKEPAEDPQKYYDAHKAEFDNAKLSGIFVPFNPPGTPASTSAPNALTEEQAHGKANDLEKKIAAGGDFAALARAESVHATASKGGDLGTVPINDPSVNIPAEIKTAVGKLQPGQVSEPIRIQGAFLIVKLDSRETVSFEKAKSGIEQKLQTERSQNVVKKEQEKYAIHVEDQDFFGSGAPAGAGPKVPSLQRPAPAPQSKP